MAEMSEMKVLTVKSLESCLPRPAETKLRRSIAVTDNRIEDQPVDQRLSGVS
jgi:hypothetical protein